MFPYLEVLILAECPVSALSPDGRYPENFPNLKYLSLNSTKIGAWDSVDLVNKFPRLSELRLQQCPLYEVAMATIIIITIINTFGVCY